MGLRGPLATGAGPGAMLAHLVEHGRQRRRVESLGMPDLHGGEDVRVGLALVQQLPHLLGQVADDAAGRAGVR